MNLSDKTRADLGWDLLLGHLAARCGTERGAASARALAPLPDIEDALARQAEVSEARALQDSGEPLTFGGVIDLGAVLERARKGGVLLGTELLDVSRALQAGARLRRHLAARAERAPRLLGRAALLAELSNVSGPIADAFDDAGGLRDSASPALRGLRQRAQALQVELGERTDRLLNEGHIAPYLQDRFVTQREDRYVVPVRADARARVRGIVHGTSASGATVFVEPEEIIDLNNRLKLAQLEVADEERRILTELSALVADAAVRIAQNLEILAHLDLVNGAARLSIDLRANPLPLQRPGPGGSGIDLRNARHPLLHLGGVAVVPSDISVPAGGALVVSGPNAGGKTVALKAAGLCALMARSGLHAPVQEGSSMPAFAEVLTDVGDDQSLERSLSTFSAHMLNLCAYLAKAQMAMTQQQGLLILLDEVAAGTDPEQGAALAQAVLEHFARCGATVIVTTHYDRLKALAAQDRRFVNASVGYDLDRLQPTYRLHLGVPGASGAVLVARRLGLPVEVAARAEALLGDRRAGIEELLQNLSRERERLLGERQAAAEARRRAEADERAAQALHAEVQAELRKARRQAHDEAVTSLRKARQELEDLARSARKAAQQDEAGARRETEVHKGRLEKLAKEVAAAAPAPEVPPGRAAGPADVLPGAKVVVPRLGGIGTVVSDVVKDKVVVQVGALKLNVDVAELLVPQGEGGRQQRRQAPVQAQVPAPVQAQADGSGQEPGQGPGGGGRIRTPASTLDVRGERVDAALARAEKFLDDAMRAGESAIFIIHGHGTGALRAALRAHFTGYPGVTSLYAAGQADGGDGVTVLELG